MNPQIGSPSNVCTVSGATQACALATAPANIGSLTEDYGMVKAYENGILFDNNYYVRITLSGAGTEASPYIIANTGQWDDFANYVTNGYKFSGKFVKLTDNISITNMAGTDDANSFQGTFDGDGNTLTFNNGTAGSPFNETYCAPFRHVKNAVIKNLHVDGTIYTSAMKAAGFVGESHGALTITGCRSSININSSKGGDGTHGGFVATLSGRDNAITFDGCVFDGSLTTTTGTIGCGGFVGWGVYNKPVVKNSLMKPSSVSANMLGSTFARWYTGEEGIHEPTIDNCYYVATTNLPTDQGTAAYVYTPATASFVPANLGAEGTAYDVSGITAYASGLKYDGQFYLVKAEVSLADNADNSGNITDGQVADVTLTGRTLYKDGQWNTLCLPFDVTLSGSVLDGASARTVTEASISGSTLNLTFGEPVNALLAGVPYIIRWDGDGSDNIVNPVFEGVAITATAPSRYDNAADDDLRVRFCGTYKSTTFDGEDQSILFMGAANTLYYPTTGAGIGAQRAYFKIGGDEEALLARRLTAFNIDFGDSGNVTGIISVTAETRSNADGWYSLGGRKHVGKPTQHSAEGRLYPQGLKNGIYINNGKKVVIK